MRWSVISGQWSDVIMDNIFPSLIVGALVLCLIAGIVVWILYRINGKASGNWPCAMGRIMKSGMRQDTNTEDTNDRFFVDIEYTFSVDGIVYKGSRVAYGYNDNGSHYLSDAHVIVSRYFKDKTVAVYYLPSNPKVCVLEPGTTKVLWSVLVVLLFALFIIGVVIFILLSGGQVL